MSNAEIIFAIVSMVAFGLVGVVYKIAMDRIDFMSLVFFVYLFSTILMGLIWLTTPSKCITMDGIGLSFLSSILAVIGMLSYIYALKVGEVSTVAPIRNLALVITVILAIYILNEKLTIEKALGVLFAILALILLSR